MKLSLLQSGCTRSLDATIHDLRMRYAAERDDFHSHFPKTTLPRILQTLGCTLRPHATERRDLVRDLLKAQREAPNALWEHLLVQAFETMLLKRRRTLSKTEDPTLDALVVDTFVAALENIPYSVRRADLMEYVVVTSRRLLAARRKAALRRVTVPPVSGVHTRTDESAPELAPSSGTEVA